MAIIGIMTSAHCYPESEEKFTFMKKLTLVIDGEVYFELCTLIYGWATIYFLPGLSALRCVRIFRYFFYLDILSSKNNLDDDDISNSSPDKMFSLTKAMHLCLTYLKSLSMEITTQKSRGGIVVLAIFFYITYLISLVYYYDRDVLSIDENSCKTLRQCYITMLRLAFYDSIGLDYFIILAQANLGYAVVLMLYLIVAAIILLNGLIGIFR